MLFWQVITLKKHREKPDYKKITPKKITISIEIFKKSITFAPETRQLMR